MWQFLCQDRTIPVLASLPRAPLGAVCNGCVHTHSHTPESREQVEVPCHPWVSMCGLPHCSTKESCGPREQPGRTANGTVTTQWAQVPQSQASKDVTEDQVTAASSSQASPAPCSALALRCPNSDISQHYAASTTDSPISQIHTPNSKLFRHIQAGDRRIRIWSQAPELCS